MPVLNDEDMRVLGELDVMSSEAAAQWRTPPAWARPLRRSLLAAASRGSAAADNIIISAADARALAEHATTSASTAEKTRRAVVGYREALTFGWQTPSMEFFEYSETLLSTLHFMITKHRPEKWPGRYRTSGIHVTSANRSRPAYTGPDADRIPGLMGELVDWLRDGDLEAPACARAAMAHLNLAAIQPWRDGNGRAARALHTLLLARSGEVVPELSSIDEWLGEQINTVLYRAALGAVQCGSFRPERDAHSWLRFVLTAHHHQAQRVKRRMAWAIRLWTDLAGLVDEQGMPERVVSALYAAALGEVRRSTYQQDEGLSRDQAIRDIQALTRAGLLTPRGNATTRVYLLAGAASGIAEAASDAVRGPGRDPYDEG
jgi:Fic family protein